MGGLHADLLLFGSISGGGIDTATVKGARLVVIVWAPAVACLLLNFVCRCVRGVAFFAHAMPAPTFVALGALRLVVAAGLFPALLIIDCVHGFLARCALIGAV
jgi:hypothetical protein